MTDKNTFDQYDGHLPSSATTPAAPADDRLAPLAPGIDPLTRRPFQYVGNVPAGDPVGQSTGKPIQEDRAPGPAVQAAGSLATDPEQKRRIIAHQLFPKLPLNEATARIFYGPNGRMAAVGEDGQPYYVDPDRPDFSALRTFSPANLATNAATLAGPALPAVGGMVGGAIGGPTTLVAGPVGAAVGAGVGDYSRQALAALLDPDSNNVPYNYRQTAGEVVGAGAGQLGGASILRVASPGRIRLGADDIRRLRADPDLLSRANKLYEESAQRGVTLTPGQATGLPSLLGSEDVITSGSVGGGPADIAKVYYEGQRKELNQMYQDYLDTVAPSAGGKTDAALQFQQGATDAERIVRQQANAAARPAYQAAERGGQVMSPDLAQLAELPAVKTALKEAATEYHNRTGKVANLDAPDFELWDLAKRKLDDFHNEAKRNGQNTTADTMDTIRQRLIDNLDTAYPTYGPARELAAPGQRLASRLKSVTGSTGMEDGTERVKSILAPIWDGSNPRAVAETRDAFIQAGRQDEWFAGIRARLQDKFDDAASGQDGLNPAMLRRQIWGKEGEREMFQAAMTPQQFAGFEKILETIEATARSKGLNSFTQPRIVGAADVVDIAQSTPGNRVVRSIGVLGSPMRAVDIVGAGADKLSSAMTKRELNRMAGRIFSEDGMALLVQASKLKPGEQRLVTMATEFLGQQAGGTDVVTGRAPIPTRPEPPMNALRY